MKRKTPNKSRTRFSAEELERGRSIVRGEKPRTSGSLRPRNRPRARVGWAHIEGNIEGYRQGSTIWVIRLSPLEETPDGRRVRQVIYVPLSLVPTEGGHTTSRVSMDNTPDSLANMDEGSGTVPSQGFVHAAGRPRKDGLDKTMMELSRQGMGARAIATELRKRGLGRISYRTVGRRLEKS